jgi:transposase
MTMDVINTRCCGLDVHKRTVVACVITPGPKRQPHEERRTFGTMTEDLVQLADWLEAQAVTHVGLESTGSYWKPVWNILEERAAFTLVLANARHIQQVPGRKTDVRDAEWIADLLRHGLIRGSFVPERAQRELRELVRYRTSLLQERSAEINRLQKSLEGANIKLAAVATDIRGKSSREILAALIGGATDAAVMAGLARGKLRAKLPQLQQALAGSFGSHQCFLVGEQLAHLDYLDEAVERASAEIAQRLRPLDDAIERLDTIPGVGRRTAEILLAEIGPDLSRFPTAAHLASWAGICPGNNESGGKRLSGKTRKGNPWLRTALVEAGQAAGRATRTYLGALYRRLVARRGKKRATVAVGHSILVIAYHVLTEDTVYQELGSQYFDQRDRLVVERRLVRRLEGLGYKVNLEPAA